MTSDETTAQNLAEARAYVGGITIEETRTDEGTSFVAVLQDGKPYGAGVAHVGTITERLRARARERFVRGALAIIDPAWDF